MAIMMVIVLIIVMQVYMETVVVNNTEYDVLVEEEARLIRFFFVHPNSFSDQNDDGDNAMAIIMMIFVYNSLQSFSSFLL